MFQGLIAAAHRLDGTTRAESVPVLLRKAYELATTAAMFRDLLKSAQQLGVPDVAEECIRHLPSHSEPQSIRANPEFQDLVLPLQHRAAPAYTPIPDRLFYVVHTAPPFTHNGYAIRTHEICKGLQTEGLDLRVLTRPGFPGDLPDGPAPETIPSKSCVDGVTYHHSAAPRLHGGNGLATYIRHATEVIEQEMRTHRPACVIGASNHATALPACLAAHRLGIPFIHEVRGFWEITRLSDPGHSAQSDAYQNQVFLGARTAQAATAVITLATPMASELAARGVPPSKVTLAPNGCDPTHFTPMPRDINLAARYLIPDTVPVIGYIGSFVSYEGLEDLVLACADLQARGHDFRLLLVGGNATPGPMGQTVIEHLEQVITQAGIKSKTILPGPIPHAEVNAHYTLIDIAPFPRRPEPVTALVPPLKPLEALAMGKAVVVSSVAPLAEMITHQETGLIFTAGENSALAEALEQLLVNQSERQRLGKAGRHWVCEHRTWQKTAAQIAAVVRRITNTA